MSLLHCLEAYGRGNLTGVQSTQRDWSPFLAHFTTWSAMRELRAVMKQASPVTQVRELLREADARSFETVQKILASRRLLGRSPSEKHGLPPCVCLSECTLPGLLSHCERYGRFGFVFAKRDIFDAGGRPCLYVGRDEYRALATLGSEQPVDTPEGRLFALSNLYEPPRSGAKLQDYTHEREWRVFADIDLARTPLSGVVAPASYIAQLQPLVEGVPILPVDTLFEWGA